MSCNAAKAWLIAVSVSNMLSSDNNKGMTPRDNNTLLATTSLDTTAKMGHCGRYFATAMAVSPLFVKTMIALAFNYRYMYNSARSRIDTGRDRATVVKTNNNPVRKPMHRNGVTASTATTTQQELPSYLVRSHHTRSGQRIQSMVDFCRRHRCSTHVLGCFS